MVFENDTNEDVVQWVERSVEAGHPWVVAVDEAGNAQTGSAPPDPGYNGFDGTEDLTIHDTRKYVLWATLMGGGRGVLTGAPGACSRPRLEDRSCSRCVG